MKWFSDLKIGIRIVTAFLIFVLFSCAICAVGAYNLKQVHGTYELAYTDSADALQRLEKISSSFQMVNKNIYGVVLADTKSDKDQHVSNIAKYKNTVDENIAGYLKMLEHYAPEEVTTETALINDVKTNFEKYLNIVNPYLSGIAMDTTRYVEAYKMLKDGSEIKAQSNAMDGAINNLVKYNTDYVAKTIDTNAKNVSKSLFLMYTVAVLGLILSIILGWIITRSITKPIEIIVQAAKKLAVGDVEIDRKIHTKDEIGILADNFGLMIDGMRQQALAAERIAEGDLTVEVAVRSEKDLLGKMLKELVEKNNEVLNNINSATAQVAAGAREISDSSVALSQGATEQASSVEELTASLEEISSQTNLNAQNANQANELAVIVKGSAEKGNDHMQGMLRAMEEINDSSANISKIIKVIDDIAFQTNLLALNAAVEAARAGEHGKGFAVVAEEVRNLAARSASAAKETTDMIENSIKKVEGGTRIAKETATALHEIVEGIGKAADFVSDIAVASNEQASGITQINQGIMEISQVVQTNSATSEEGAAASEELSSQAELLKDIVSKYKLKKVGQNQGGYTELSPEILKMLGDMNEKNGSKHEIKNDRSDTAKKLRGSLSDKEFGKY